MESPHAGPEALKAFWREQFGELDAEREELLERVERKAQKSRVREWAAAASSSGR